MRGLSLAQPVLKCRHVEDEPGDNRGDTIHIDRLKNLAAPVRHQSFYLRRDCTVFFRRTAEKMDHYHGTSGGLRMIGFDSAFADAVQQVVFGAELVVRHGSRRRVQTEPRAGGDVSLRRPNGPTPP